MQEIGVRMAMGTEPQNVMGMMLRQALLLTVVGVALGLAGALGLTRLLTGMLFKRKPSDPETFLTVTAALIVVALAACRIPARRAMRVDPMEA
jgi:putative ABC transport system permease protein